MMAKKQFWPTKDQSTQNPINNEEMAAVCMHCVYHGFISTPQTYSPFQKECPIWGPAAGDQLLLRPVICGADVRPRGCREIALVSLARAAWAVAMQSAHARALLPALPWQLM